MTRFVTNKIGTESTQNCSTTGVDRLLEKPISCSCPSFPFPDSL